MKRIKLFLSALEAQLAIALTPDVKKQYCDDAKLLAPKILNGIWLEIAIIGISVLEATIKNTTTVTS